MCRPLERDLDPLASRPTDLPDRRVCEDCMSIYNTLMNACVRAEIFGPRPQSIRSADRVHRSTVNIGWREPKGSPAAAVRIYGCRSTASRHRARAPHSCLIASMIAVSRSREVSPTIRMLGPLEITSTIQGLSLKLITKGVGGWDLQNSASRRFPKGLS